MHKVKLSAVIGVTVVCFVLGGLWYSPVLFGNAYAALRSAMTHASPPPAPSPAELIAEVVRCFVITYAFAYFLLRLGISTARGALTFALQVWLGFEAFVLSGAVVHEAYPVGLFAIHAGDALVKGLISCLLLVRWHRGAATVPASGTSYPRTALYVAEIKRARDLSRAFRLVHCPSAHLPLSLAAYSTCCADRTP